MNYQTLLFSPAGRINRAKFWIGMLIVTGVGVVVSILFAILGAVVGGNEATEPGSFSVHGVTAIPYIVLGFAYTIFIFWSSICISIKRCHDRDRSGWFMLVGVIPVVGLWYVIEVAFLPGMPGPNRFGPDPLGQTAVQAFAA